MRQKAGTGTGRQARRSKGLTIGTFHAICRGFWGSSPADRGGFAGPGEAASRRPGAQGLPAKLVRRVSQLKTAAPPIWKRCFYGYCRRQQAIPASLDFDDLLRRALEEGLWVGIPLSTTCWWTSSGLQRPTIPAGAPVGQGEKASVIGHPDQSIYRVSGAPKAGCFDRLQEDLPQLEDHPPDWRTTAPPGKSCPVPFPPSPPSRGGGGAPSQPGRRVPGGAAG